jgi:cell division protease FtsH
MFMELAALGAGSVVRDADVFDSRERARQVRLTRLAIVLALVGVPVIGRSAAGLVRYLQGNYQAAAGDFHWPVPGIPSAYAPYVPGFILVLLLAVVMAGPLLMAGRSPHVLYRPEELGMGLSDVVGASVVVEEVVKTLNLFLAHRTFEQHMGGRPRRAILFEGPPGTGKTYIAKAMAAEAGVPFLFVSSSAFQSMFYGQTNRKIRAYFRALRNYSRREGGAVGFIEEIDAIGASRGGMGGGHRSEGITGVVNELLVQLQSFDVPPTSTRMVNAVIDVANRWLPAGHTISKRRYAAPNFLVVGATNRAADLDPALLRPGRFDKTVRVDLPNRSGRREIFDYYLARKAHSPELDDAGARDDLASATHGYSPVMIEHLLDEALVWALRSGRSQMNPEDVQKARMTEELGLAQPVTYTDAERRVIATHEAGHATVAWFAAPGRRLDVLSIIKRSESLGMLAHSETEERFTRTHSECEALLRIAMGGLVAEELYFGETTTGPAGDLVAATRLAAHMVGAYGMAGSLISVGASGSPGDVVSKVLSDETCREAVDRLLETARQQAREVLLGHLGVVDGLRDALVARDELVGDQIAEVVAAAQDAALPNVAVAPNAAVPALVAGGAGAGPFLSGGEPAAPPVVIDIRGAGPVPGPPVPPPAPADGAGADGASTSAG